MEVQAVVNKLPNGKSTTCSRRRNKIGVLEYWSDGVMEAKDHPFALSLLSFAGRCR